MLENFKQLGREQMFVIVCFALSLLVSFLFGYLIFRYEKIEICKSDVEIVHTENIYK